MQEELNRADPLLLEFLDLDAYKDREEFIIKHEDELSDRTIDMMASSLDIILEDEGTVFSKAQLLLSAMRIHGKYETNRFR